MKKIFIAPIKQKNKYSENEFSLTTNWIKLFNNIGFFSFTTTGNKAAMIKKISVEFDALVLCGGGEIYKFQKNYINLQRDKFEKKLIKNFLLKKKPILAVCRGFQLIASINNGKFEKSNKHVRETHKLKINKKSVFVRCKKLTTNSFHRNVLKSIGKKFTVVSRSNDGFIEIAENVDEKILCFMFHPERYNFSNKEIRKIIKNFIYGSSNFSSRKR
jgi:putative glutamine amidotransferase